MIEEKQTLKKVLGLWDSTAIAVAVVIGVGIFRVPAEVASYLMSPALIILAWLAGGLIVLTGALCYAELSSSFPVTGGNYVYLKESYGHLAGFLFGWTELVAVRPGSIAAVAFISAEYASSLFSITSTNVKPLAIFAIFLLSSINIFGMRYGKNVQRLFTALSVSALVALIVLGGLSGKGDLTHFCQALPSFDAKVLSSFGLALIPILWTYGGWHENTFVAGETRNAGKILPAALGTSVAITVSLYVAVNFLYIYLVPAEEMAASKLIGSAVFNILYGPIGQKVFEAVVIISSFACINSMIITGSRITYAMAIDSAVFSYLSFLSRRFATPARAIMINGLWASILILLGSFTKLLLFTGTLVWLFFGLAGIGLFILRRKFPDMTRPYKVPLYPLIPAIFIIICIYLFVNALLFSPVSSMAGLAILACGLPIYLVAKKKGPAK